MSSIEANITIDLSDGDNIDRIISELRRKLSNINSKDTVVNVQEVDDPSTINNPKRYV